MNFFYWPYKMELNKAMRMCSKNNSALAERQIITSTGLAFNKVLQFSRKDSQFLRMKNGSLKYCQLQLCWSYFVPVQPRWEHGTYVQANRRVSQPLHTYHPPGTLFCQSSVMEHKVVLGGLIYQQQPLTSSPHPSKPHFKISSSCPPCSFPMPT